MASLIHLYITNTVPRINGPRTTLQLKLFRIPFELLNCFGSCSVHQIEIFTISIDLNQTEMLVHI